jgi:hypothetical protein
MAPNDTRKRTFVLFLDKQNTTDIKKLEDLLKSFKGAPHYYDIKVSFISSLVDYTPY